MLFLSLGSNYTFSQAWRHLWTIGGRMDTVKLEQALTKRYDGKEAILYHKGRDALQSAVKMATGGQGDVVVTSLTCYSVVEAVEAAGCRVIYAEADHQTLQFNPQILEKILAKQPVKAIIIQNMLGIPVNINDMIKLAKKYRVAIIEDIAHAVGGHYESGQEIGTVGDYTMLSFGRDKMLDTINGGALVIRTNQSNTKKYQPTTNPPLLQQFRDRIYPQIAWYSRLLFPYKIGQYILAAAYKTKLAVKAADGGANLHRKMPHWQAKLGLRQLEELDKKVAMRQQKQQQYLQELSHLATNYSSNAIRLPLLIKNRDEVIDNLKQAGYSIEDIWYDLPIAPKRLYHRVNFPEQDFPTTIQICDHIINLPTHQLVTDDDIKKICKIVKRKAEIWKF